MTTRRMTGQGFRYSRMNAWQVGQNMELFQRYLLSSKGGTVPEGLPAVPVLGLPKLMQKSCCAAGGV